MAIASVRSVHIYRHFYYQGGDPGTEKVPQWQIFMVLAVSWLGALSECAGAWIGYKLYLNYHEEEMAMGGPLLGGPPLAPIMNLRGYGGYGGGYAVTK